MAGKTIAVSGFGNVAWGVCKKAAQLGAKVVTLSGPDGYIYDPDGVVTEEKINYMLEMRSSNRNRVQDYADKFGVEFFPKQKPWGRKVDICMPCAYQNEIGMKEAQQMVDNGIKYYIEVANMPTTNEALYFLMDKGLTVAPSKAVNAGGVSVSGLEMSQNSERLSFRQRPRDEPELRAPQLEGRGSGFSAPQHHGQHLRRLRGSGREVRSWLQPGGWRQHRWLPEGGRRHDGPGHRLIA